MSEHFIKNIEIKNFKCFEDFKADGFGRVNLIGGKNNVGKTAFMEACYINCYSIEPLSMFTSIMDVNYWRNSLEYIKNKFEIKNVFEKTYNYSVLSNINKTQYSLINSNGIKKYDFIINNIENSINSNEFSYQLNYINNIFFIDNYGFSNKKLKVAFEAVQRRDKEEVLYKYINEFDNNILNFKIIGGDKPQCKVKNGEYRDINEFGDGLKHWISIICALYASEDGYLFIDEIDNGVHYMQLDKLWEIILTISKQQNVQVFATTHSKECIESYARVAKELEDEEITFFKLGRNQKDELKGMVYPYDWFVDSIEQEQELRGW